MQHCDFSAYTRILEEELVPAMGCTEPIALALGAAKAREVLGCLPERVTVLASGSIIKNVKSVVVPHTDHLRGIPAAVSVGIVAGDPARKLEVISGIDPEQTRAAKTFMETTPIEVKHLEGDLNFDVIITVAKGETEASVRIANSHTNIVYIRRNDEVLLDIPVRCEADEGMSDHSILSGEGIWEYVNAVEIAAIKPLLSRQIEYNTAIAAEGIRGEYGASIGRVMLAAYGEDVRNRAKAMAAAGSDARMNGCELPVIINSGSGNQGITCCLPLVEYAKSLGCDEERLYRALALSNLLAIHIKSGIGRLSAYCGAVSAGAAAGGGIAYLHGGDYRAVIHTVVNALGIVSGIICDGAKASCAAKIASAVEAGILGMQMFRQGSQFYGGDGIVSKGVENTIANVSRLATEGMRKTDAEIIKIMLS